jgi:hypothetical protein
MKRKVSAGIDAGLRGMTSAGQERDAHAFWGDFRARARMVPQQALEPARRGAGAWGWSAALAGAAVVALAVFLLPVSAPAGNRIESLEVMGDYSGVFILDDGAKGGTIVWISGMNGEDAE